MTTFNSNPGKVTTYEDADSTALEVHFTTTAARDAYAAALAGASTSAQKRAVLKNYKDSAYGGFWGTTSAVI